MGLASSQSWALLSIWGVNFINVIIYIERDTQSCILKFFCLLAAAAAAYIHFKDSQSSSSPDHFRYTYRLYLELIVFQLIKLRWGGSHAVTKLD